METDEEERRPLRELLRERQAERDASIIREYGPTATLRDQFAMAALSKLIEAEFADPEADSAQAYQYADAMLVARDKR